MSNLRTRAEHEALGGSPWADFDSEYRCVRKAKTLPSQETNLETSEMEKGKQGDVSASQLLPERPRSIALAVVAANAVHAAWEAGYTSGFNAGRLAGMDRAVEIVKPDDGIPYTRDNPPF